MVVESVQKDRIVVVGDEDFRLGFELVGIEGFNSTEFENLVAKGSGIGIIILSEKSYDGFSLKLKNKIDTILKPIVVIMSENDVKGGNLRDMVIRALGVDLLKDK